MIGCDSERSAEVLREVYAPLTDGSYYQRSDAIPQPDRATDSAAAHRDQHQERGTDQARLQRISGHEDFFHQCGRFGLRVGGRRREQVVHGVGTDSRIGPRFLNPGIGYGGSCFPKDVMAFRAVARECGYDFRLLDEVMRINEDQRQRFLRKVRSALWTLRGKNLGVLGLAFKGGTDDIRESPALFLVQALLQEGSRITAYDPAAMERAQRDR